jgi:ABC-type transporter Mla maintaining outer membrane lipid asymmetry permease subunit MlaE
VAFLSGGQAQRLAVARTLAGGRKLIFLDEPSVGLDPYRVQLLAKQLGILSKSGTAIVLVTHDVALAAGISDRVLFLDGEKGLRDLLDGHGQGSSRGSPQAAPQASDESSKTSETERLRLRARLERTFLEALTAAESGADEKQPIATNRFVRLLGRIVEPLGIAPVALESTASAWANAQDFLRIFWKTLRLAILGPLVFFAVVSMLLGFTILFAIIHVTPEGLAPATVVREIGGSYVTALSPALSAFLFVAASGNAVNAWLGSMSLTRQIAALEALGIRRERYLWAPVWGGLALAYLVIAVLFALGLLVGGTLLCSFEHIPQGWMLLSSDLLNPRPSQVRFVIRAVWLVFLYSGGIAADVVSKGSRDKPSSESVTRGMTSSVVSCTLWVVALELGSVLWLFSLTGAGSQ